MYTIAVSEIEAAKGQHPYYGYNAVGDNGSLYAVHSVVDGQIFVKGLAHDNLARVVRTGQKIVSTELVRVRIEFATDLGDAKGTLSFGDGERVGGRINHRVLESVED